MNELLNMSEVYSLRLAQTLLHFLWQAAAIGMLVFLVEKIQLKLSARKKYTMHVAALLVMAGCLPLTFAFVPNSESMHSDLRQLSTSERIATFPLTQPSNEHNSLSAIAESDSSTPLDSTTETEAVSQPPNESPAITVPNGLTEKNVTGPLNQNLAAAELEQVETTNDSFLSMTALFVTALYAMCVVGMLLRLAWALRGGHRLRMGAKKVSDSRIVSSLTKQAQKMGLRIVPAIAYCEQVSIPIVVGILRPVILLPTSLASGLSPDQLEAVIAHELAHLRRFDPIVNLGQRLIEAVAFFHPAVWYVSHLIDVEREHAADDLVVAAGWRNVDYANALVCMAEFSKQLRLKPSSLALAASGSNDSEFKRRVVRLLGGENSHLRLTHSGLAMFLLAISSIIVTPFMVQALDQSSGSTESVGTNNARVGRTIDNFTLRDFRGRSHSLEDFADNRIVVVAFLGTECPLAKLYGKRLDELSKQYKTNNVAFLGINSNQQDTPTELAQYARQHGIDFPLLKDPANRIADLFRAERTPEVFVLDENRKVRYWGRIDDQFGVGYTKPAAKQNYLTAALDELLASREVSFPQTESVGCYISRVQRDAPTGNITYATHIASIMQKRCVECHREGGIAPFSLESYDDVSAWSETIAEVVNDRRMPPWHANPKYGHFSNDGRMPLEEKRLLLNWIENAAPRGEGDLPDVQPFEDGWLLGQPDLVLKMPTAVDVPATGIVDYQYVEIDPGFTEGKWIRASELKPGVRSVVHHIIVFINPPGGDPILEERGVGFETVGGYVPGAAPMRLPVGVARYVPPGSTFVMQLHYTPDGTPRKDQSKIGLYFADAETVHHTMQTGVVANLDFVIPAGANDHRVTAQHRFSHDMELHTLAPHMHFRGKSFRFEATYPHGAKEILLDVPDYDFNWQHAYQLATPKLMPEGTLLTCTAVFDNSKNNLSNPDPSVAVRWGEQSWEEMMLGYFDGIFVNQDMSIPEPTIHANGDETFRVRFRYKPDRPAKTINLAGTFNEWNTSSHPLKDPDGDGIFTTDLTVRKGEYRYKFVIDGHYWTHDPASRILTGFLHESFFTTENHNHARKAGD